MPGRRLKTVAAVILAVVAAVPYAVAAIQIVKENLKAQQETLRSVTEK